MLYQLHIHNYAIIDSLEINFSNHLNIITGETGAGKSILMGALSLILGDRSDNSVLLDKQKKCFVEGVFKTKNNAVTAFLQKHELDGDEEIIIRREISSKGKSRAFINDTPVTLGQLKQLSILLVDLHQQFDTLELNSNNFQREVVDALAGNAKLLEEYHSVFKKHQSIVKELEQLHFDQNAANKEFDYHKFLFDELEEAGFSENEIENIDAEIKLISNSESIKLILSEIYFQMEESEGSLIQQLKIVENKLQSPANNFPELKVLNERLHSVEVELKDIVSEIGTVNNQLVYDAERINVLNDRMAKGYNLLKKHQVNATSQLLEIKNNLEVELQKVTNLTEMINSKEKIAEEYFKKAFALAEKISEKRQKEIKPFEDKVNKLLNQVGMPNARISIDIKRLNEINLFGFDAIEFLFNANKSSSSEPLRKVASGGELSRIMLSIKSLVAKSVQLPTLIFDEIDTGISGEAARQVGNIIKALSAQHQLILITHQPQIAARAETHFFVYKEMRNNQVVTLIKVLDKDERVTAIATMLSGKKPTAAAFENAKEMMSH